MPSFPAWDTIKPTLRAPRATVPILIGSGAMDPVGGFSTFVQALAGRYQALGVQDLTVKLHEGARHELLNETNRDEVQADVLAWLDAHI